MPIDIEQFQAAKAPLTERILRFLSEHRDKAFTRLEIMAACEGYPDLGWMNTFTALTRGKQNDISPHYQNALEELLKADQIDSAIYQGATYYTTKRK